MVLTDPEKQFIQKNYRKLSVRQIAKELGCSRPEAERYIATLSQTDTLGTARVVPRIPPVFLTLFLFLLTFITYSNSIRYEFVWDDKIQIVQNPLIKDHSVKGIVEIFKLPVGVIKGNKDYTSESYRPVHVLTYWLSDMFGSLHPTAYHLTNILFQCTAAILLFLLLLKILDNKEIAFWTSAFFAVHPMQIAAVTYVSGRAESLTTIFMLVSFTFFYEAGRRDHLKHILLILLSAVSFAIALFTKEIAIVLPILCLAYVYFFKKKESSQTRPVDFIGYLVVIAGYFWVRVSILGEIGQGGIGDLPMTERILAVPMSVFHYVRLLFLPYGLHMAYQLPIPSLNEPTVMLGFILVLVLIVFTWLSRKSSLVFFGFLWFWIFFIPVLNIFVLLNGPIAEHWLYNAIIGFFIAVTASLLLPRWKDIYLRKIIEPILIASIFYLAITTYHSNDVWKDDITLYRNILKYTKHFADIYSNLGKAYVEKGMLNEAEENFKKALEVDPNHDKAKHNLETVKRQKAEMGYAT